MAKWAFMSRLCLLWAFFAPTAWTQGNFDLQLDTLHIPGLPGLHSFAVATHQGKWLLIGGRRDGMHQKFNAFNTGGANQQIMVVNPETGLLRQSSMAGLPDSLQEQLRSANMEFYQHGETLLFIGGYGRSERAQNHVTYPYLTLIDVPGLMAAVETGGALQAHFRQIRSDFFGVTGGQLHLLADTFYLVGGHRFDGVYSANSANPTQFYTNAIRKFTLDRIGLDAQIGYKGEIIDELNLHRRDYNLAPQIYEDGSQGLAIYSGVFQPGLALAPFLNMIEIRPSGHKPVPGFNQYLANYHCAKVPLYDAATREMHTVFLGGISNYYLDEKDSLIKDNRLPFVKTVSRVSRKPDGTCREVPFDLELPWYTGAGAEFILAARTPVFSNGVIDYDRLPQGRQLLGYIVGGIATPENQRNPFVANNTAVTSANAPLIRVFVDKNVSGVPEKPLGGSYHLDLKASPNPATDHWQISLQLPRSGKVRALLQDAGGKIVQIKNLEHLPAGPFQFELPATVYPSGVYRLTVNIDGVYSETLQLLRIAP